MRTIFHDAVNRTDSGFRVVSPGLIIQRWHELALEAFRFVLHEIVGLLICSQGALGVLND